MKRKLRHKPLSGKGHSCESGNKSLHERPQRRFELLATSRVWICSTAGDRCASDKPRCAFRTLRSARAAIARAAHSDR